MIGYLFQTDGGCTEISLSQYQKGDDIPVSILGPEYAQEEGPFMQCFFSESSNYFLLMSNDNDLLSDYQASKLAVNSALRHYFPNSPYKGNILLVRIDDDDTIVSGEWSKDELSNYRMGYSPQEQRGINLPIIVTTKEYQEMGLQEMP